MLKTKKCKVCGYEFTYDDRVAINPFVEPHGEGAQYYFDLWHFFVEHCPQCGYASKDIGHTFNRNVVKDEKYQAIDEIELLKELSSARPNRIADYLKASYYYNSIGDTISEIKCLLQAGDMVYSELMYWEEYIFDNTQAVTSLIGKAQQNEFEKFADKLINTALEKLEEYVKNNPEDVDMQLLLAGTLSDGEKVQVMKGAKILSQLKTKNLTSGQKDALRFLLQEIGA